LGAYQLGKYYYVIAVVTYFGIFAVLGTVDYGQREIAKRQDDILERSKTFWDVLVFRLFFIFVALIIYIPVIFSPLLNTAYSISLI
jgi:O-antigen/teichoic acid export membrane protein